jgi:hypothetical protein
MFWVEGRERILFHIAVPTCAQYCFWLLLETILTTQAWFQRSSVEIRSNYRRDRDVSWICAVITEGTEGGMRRTATPRA